MKKDPISALTLIGPESITAEAAIDPQIHYPANGCGKQEESHSDLPQLPINLQSLREAQERLTALSLLTMP